MDNQDKTTFSLDDDEIVEEEVIERDEEYDDGEDYDEEYDDEYDDEEYDDEEGYDDEYDDEEYDDGYNDDYYDDRLNKVLDEIAELKRGMVPAVQQQQQQPPTVIPPQYIYQPTAPPAGSEVVMYNEISRLRDELAKNQSSLEMQKELTRLKDDMARDQKIAESQYNAEIRSLQNRIEELLKNGSGPQGELAAPQETAHIEGGHSGLDLEKLLSINEAVLRATRDSDMRLQSEIGQLKKQLEDIPSLKELNGAVSAVKKAASNADGANAETLNKLSEDIASLRAVVEEKCGAPQTVVNAVPTVGYVNVPNAQCGSSDVSASELLRQLYEIKTVLGNTSEAAVKRTQVLSDLVNDYKKVRFDINSQSTLYKDKLVSVYGYAKKLEECNEQDAIDLINAANEMIAELASQPLTRSVFADVASFCSESGAATVTTAMRDNAERFFGIKERLAAAPVQSYADHLPDLLAVVNALEDNRNESENAKTVGDITVALQDENRDDDAIRSELASLTELTVSDVVALPQLDAPKTYTAVHTANGENIFGKIEELKAAVLDSAAASAAVAAAVAEQASSAENAPNPEPVEAVAQQPADAAPAADDGKINELLSAVEDLKTKLTAATDTRDVSGALEEIRGNYVEMTNKLVDISEKIQQPAVETQASAEEPAPVLSDVEKQQMIDDLAYIRNKLDEHGQFIDQISDMRSDILGISSSIDISGPITEQINSVLTEVNSQFDKLYEDLSNVLIESEANIIGRLSDNGENPVDVIELAKADILADTQSIKDTLLTVSDSIFALPLAETLDAARADILADTQAIKDSLAAVTDTVVELQVNDAIERLRNDVTAFIEQTAANTDAAIVDRQKLLDDVAFLREQAELAIAEGEQTVEIEDDASASAQDGDKLVAYLDDIAARVAVLANISDDVSVTKDSVNVINDSVLALADTANVINDNIAAVSDNITAVADNVSVINENINAVTDSIATLADTVRPIADDAVAARDAATAALDALAPVAEQLNAILDRLDNAPQQYADELAESEQDVNVAAGTLSDEELVELKDSLNTILDTLPLFPQADDVVAARDNSYAILDALALMPQADDVSVTRDNVSAILDIVTALSDSLDAMSAGQAPAQPAEDVIALREIVDGTAEDVKYIRQKLDDAPQTEEQVEDLANIMQDIGLVLDKIEEYERVSAANKQEIIDAVSGIREEIHINTLDETMSAAGIDGETRDALVGEITDIRERLGNIESVAQTTSELNAATLDSINAQLADLQAVLEERLSTAASGDEAENFGNDNMQALIDELAGIREKLDAGTEYDTVEEILSLREDIKAARIVDQDEVSGELEAIKNELAAISSGNILDEIRALREDIVNLPSGDGNSAPTDGEINLVLNEIVSLRDEVFAFKDEVLNVTAAIEPQTEQTESTDNSDDMNTILDELTALRADQTAITDNLDELKDIISRRTTIGSNDGEEQEDGISSNAPGGLDVVLDEIINLKNDIDRIEESIGGDRLDAISEQVEEIRAVIDELRGVQSNDQAAVADSAVPVDLTPIMEQFETVNAALDDIRLNQEAGVMSDADGAQGTVADRFDELHAEIAEIKTSIGSIVPPDYADEIAELRAEIDALRAENEQLKQSGADAVGAELAELKEAIRDMTLSFTPTTADGDTSYAALIDEIRGLKDQIADAGMQSANVSATLDEDTLQSIRDALASQNASAMGDELAEIRDEIAQLRSLTTVTAESGGMAEVAAIRDEIAELKAMLSASDSLVGVAEDINAIKTDVRTLKDEPDLGVMNEILALRDEFQTLREQIEDVKRIAGETDREADDTIMNEIQSLRDQLFAISMANVNDPASGESNYESYNNIILDEIASLRDQVSTAGSAIDMSEVTDEVADLKAALDKREDLYNALSSRIAALNNDATNNRILEELSNLRTDMANQRDADLTTLNFMSEMAHLLERQNHYLTQNAGSKISDEIESLKAEIASSDAVAEEVAKLREIMTQSGNASDNETILNELADLREELSSEKPSRENELILDAIARLRDEITVLAEHEKVRDMNSDADLSDSLSDLKDQLNEIAGIVEPSEKKPPQQKSVGGAKRGRKPGSKNGTKSTSRSASNRSATATKSTGGAKRGRKPAQKPQEQSEYNPNPITTIIEPIVADDDFDAKISEQIGNLGGNDEMSLNLKAVNTTDAMDVADKLAKQVANKLIMEQLVEQLGDGGVSEERVDEILRDILPQEFTTIAETEASDKVRRLANQLVLDKLRARLNSNRNGDDD